MPDKATKKFIFSQKITRILAVFMGTLLLFSTTQIVIEHVLNKKIQQQERLINNQLAKQRLGELINKNLILLELLFSKSLEAKNKYAAVKARKEADTTIEALKQLLPILESGGTYTHAIIVNLNTTDEVTETITYTREPAQSDILSSDSTNVVIEVIDILPKVLELQSLMKNITAIKAQQLTGNQKGSEKNSPSLLSTQDLQFFTLQAETLLLRCRENSNKILFDTTVSVQNHREIGAKLTRQATLVRTYFYIVLQILIVVMFLFFFVRITAILRAAANSQLEKQKLFSRLQEVNASLEEIVNNLPVGIVIVSSDKKIIQVNTEAERILGYNEGEAKQLLNGNVCHSHYCSLPENQCPVFDHHKRRIILQERTAIKKDKSTLSILKSVIPIVLNGEEVLLEAFMDISAIKNAEKAIVTAKTAAESANLAKSEFLTNMSHEIRTPMNAIIGFTDLLIKTESDKSRQKQLDMIKQSANALLNLINEILDFSKIEAGKIQIETHSFSLDNLLHQITSIFYGDARDKNIELELDIKNDIPDRVIGDELRLRQVLINLTGNAIKFTDQGKVLLSLKYNKPYFIFTIEDTGIGIAQERIEDIFKTFVQADSSTERKYGGSGLGLSISNSLINLMGGNIDVNSKVGEGTSFTISLPLEIEQTGESIQIHSQPVDLNNLRPAGPIRALVVEDNMTNNELTREMLTHLDIDSDSAENGLIGLQMMESQQYDFILLDMHMPVLSGPDTLRAMKENGTLETIPVVAMTADAIVGHDQKYLDAGCKAYLSKPFTMDVLQETIITLLPDLFIEKTSLSSPPYKKHDSFTSDERDLLEEALRILQKNLDIFDPEELEILADDMQRASSNDRIIVFSAQLKSCAETFEDTMIPELINNCNQLLQQVE